jgi:hypothetical protein
MGRKYDVFISYRRQGGDQTAKIICDRLMDAGYRVFYDVEALRSGAFNTMLYSVIDECRDVIVVLSQNSLDRCNDENDWVRLEITHALKTGKNVIPVFLRSFEFPEKLPEDIAPLRYQNGLEASSEFFDAFIGKLKLFLKSKPTLLQRIRQNVVFRRTLPFLLALLIVLGIGSGAYVLIKNRAQTFPKTQEQKNIANEALNYIQQNIALIDGAFGEVSAAYKACENYLIDMDPVQYEAAEAAINRGYGSISRLDFSQYALSDNLTDKIDRTPINKSDLVAVNEYNSVLCELFKSNLLFIKQVINEDSALDTATKRKIVEIYVKMLESDAQTVTYGINDLLLPVDSGFLTEFKQKYLPMFVNLPFGKQLWLNDKAELERLSDSVYNQQLQLQNDLASIVGTENYSFLQEKSELEQYARENGMSQSEIDAFLANIVDKSESIATMKQQLNEASTKLADIKNQAREKFAPKAEDDPGMLWGKMLRFMSLQLYEDAVKCAQMYQQKVQVGSPEAKEYVPAAIRFINQIASTGVDYGVIVCGYEPGKPEHAVYEIGDIIVAINDVMCLNFNKFVELMPSGREYKVTILRPDAEGRLEFQEKTVPSGQPKIQLLDLTEREQD